MPMEILMSGIWKLLNGSKVGLYKVTPVPFHEGKGSVNQDSENSVYIVLMCAR